MYTLDNGWVVERSSKNVPILKVTPVTGTIFQVYKDVPISNEIFKDIARGERSVKHLIRKYNLHNLIIDFERKKVRVKTKQNSKNKYYGRGFIVTQERNRFFIEYQLSIQGGGSRKFEIREEIYRTARTGKYTATDLFKKYNLYHLDIPENDVKS